MFRVVLAHIPPSANATGEAKDRYRKRIQSWLDAIDIPAFEGDERLYGRIIYFNHEPTNVRDLHNIFKPTFDLLKGRAYADDRAIVYFEGFRLDMAASGDWFEVEIDDDLDEGVDVAVLQRRTCLLIEIGRLPVQEASAVHVTWL